MFRKIFFAWLAIKELGFTQVGLFALYRLLVTSGYYRWRTPISTRMNKPVKSCFQPVFTIPTREELLMLIGERSEGIVSEADEIIAGQVRLFGGRLRPLNISPNESRQHWSRSKPLPDQDIKLIWEPARFGWVFTLGRAFVLTREEKYPEAFWKYWEEFSQGNPVNCGPNWESGQEVALRLISYLFAAQVFQDSIHSTPDRKNGLLTTIADHAGRIPPTLLYSRSQHNNHLISEACGLYLAGVAIPGHPRADRWRKTGWYWLEKGFESQIAADGTYVQHSMNYHRMMLHLALLGQMAAKIDHKGFSQTVKTRLAAATRWILAQTFLESGDAPNLGNNDGANLLPFGMNEFRDHRPVGQAAAAAFLEETPFPSGPWDELSAWLGIQTPNSIPPTQNVSSPAVRRLGDSNEWASLRAVHFNSRPAHADQLHVDLWYHGKNILIDPGTGAYNQPPIWLNPLVHSGYHNTVTVDEVDPMRRAGRFLWLKWDQAEWIESECVAGKKLAARHFGYSELKIQHQRLLTWEKPGQWIVQDKISTPPAGISHPVSIHWLLPDGEAVIEGTRLILASGDHTITVNTLVEGAGKEIPFTQRLVRAGKLIYGDGKACETEGWYSPTYLELLPAHSYKVILSIDSPVIVTTRISIEPTVAGGTTGHNTL